MTAWHVAPALDTLRDQINAAHPGRDRSSDGAIGDAAHAARKSDHNPAWDAGGVVRARDFDVDGIPVGPILAALERDPRTGLLIYNHRYWTRGHGWRPYTGINPHTGHFHISVRHGTQYENDTSAWPLGPQEDAMTPELAARLDQIVKWIDGRINDLARLENANRDALASFTRKAVTDAVKTVPGVDPAVVEAAVEKAFTDAIESIERTTTTVNVKETP